MFGWIWPTLPVRHECYFFSTSASFHNSRNINFQYNSKDWRNVLLYSTVFYYLTKVSIKYHPSKLLFEWILWSKSAIFHLIQITFYVPKKNSGFMNKLLKIEIVCASVYRLLYRLLFMSSFICVLFQSFVCSCSDFCAFFVISRLYISELRKPLVRSFSFWRYLILSGPQVG